MFERPDPIAVHVNATNNGGEWYGVGVDGVTAIKWAEFPGDMAMKPSLQIFKGDVLFAETLFGNCLSVQYAKDQPSF